MRTFNKYAEQLAQWDLYPKSNYQRMFYTLGLCGEAGEVAEKVKKVFRDRKGKFTKATCKEIEKELGDVLWYMTRLADSLGLSLESVANANIEKLKSRRKRGKLHGDGDNR